MGLLSTIGAASGRAFGFTRSAIAAATDAFFNRVTLLLPGNGTNGAQNNTFLDSSSNNFTITRNGNTTQGTFSPFSQTGWSNYFNSANTDYLTLPYNSVILGSNDFTLEAWVYISNYSNIYTIFNSQTNASTAGGSSYGFNIQQTTGYVQAIWYLGGGFAELIGTTGVPLNAWNHIAFARTGGTMSLYVNGVRQATRSDQGTNYINDGSASFYPSIGRNGNFYPMNGYISDFRIIIGSGGYNATNSSITVPTSPLTSPANTVLLTCNSNRFVDRNTQVAAKIITVNGSPSVQAFSPFAPTAAYDAAVVGGSGYFDGTGDYLVNSSMSPTITLGTNDFCMEGWAYFTSFNFGAYGAPIISFGGTGSQWMIRANKTSASTTSANYYFSNNGTFIPAAGFSSGVSGGTLYLNQWNHVAVVRQGSSFRLYVNGTLASTVTDSASMTAAISSVTIGADTSPGNGLMAGYIASTRLVVGDFVYSGSTITVPTAPFTSNANTRLLTNFTNAGITDATAKNVLETVGNAQISTTQSKFGGSSMYFDGTGDYLSLPVQRTIELGSSDWTFETWVYMNGVSSQQSIIYLNGNASGYAALNLQVQSGALNLWLSANGGSWSLQQNTIGTITANIWNHIAIVKVGTNIKVYINGTNVSGSGYTVAASLMTTYTLNQIGVYNTSSSALNGYLDDIRLTLGVARYTSNFTAPTAAYPLQ